MPSHPATLRTVSSATASAEIRPRNTRTLRSSRQSDRLLPRDRVDLAFQEGQERGQNLLSADASQTGSPPSPPRHQQGSAGITPPVAHRALMGNRAKGHGRLNWVGTWNRPVLIAGANQISVPLLLERRVLPATQ